MDEKRRSKRPKPIDDGSWDCSVCTYKNSPEAFKCEMCDVRKGTSTRKPRLNAQLVAQQVAQQFTPPPKKDAPTPGLKKEKEKEKEKEKRKDKTDSSEEGSQPPEKKDKKEKPSTSTTSQTKKSNRPPRLKNIDRTSGQSMEVTYGNVTVIITDYKPKKERNSLSDSQMSTQSSQSNSSLSSEKGDAKSVVPKHEQNGEVEVDEKS